MSHENTRKHYLMLCELHNPFIHGDMETNGHYLVFKKFDPITKLSYAYLYGNDEYDDEYEDDEYENDEFFVTNIDDEQQWLQSQYSSQTSPYDNHPTIRNYRNIIMRPDYIKPEIAEYILLPSSEAIAILKTFWLRIIQRTWKKVFQQRQQIISQRRNITNLSHRDITGKWGHTCYALPSIKGMLSTFK